MRCKGQPASYQLFQLFVVGTLVVTVCFMFVRAVHSWTVIVGLVCFVIGHHRICRQQSAREVTSAAARSATAVREQRLYAIQQLHSRRHSHSVRVVNGVLPAHHRKTAKAFCYCHPHQSRCLGARSERSIQSTALLRFRTPLLHPWTRV